MEETYTLVPGGIGKWNQITIRLLWLAKCSRLNLARGRWCRLGFRSWSWGGLGLGLSLLGIQRTDLELTLVLLQDSLIVILPELF